jgi:hypothetical protein
MYSSKNKRGVGQFARKLKKVLTLKCLMITCVLVVITWNLIAYFYTSANKVRTPFFHVKRCTLCRSPLLLLLCFLLINGSCSPHNKHTIGY